MTEQDHLSTSDLAGTRRTPTEVATPSPPEQSRSDAEGSSQGDPERDAQPNDSVDSGNSPLFDQSDRSSFQERWNAVQTGFVDEPRKSVEQADTLVAEAMTRLAETFAHERQTLESQWGEGANVSTEDLRVALQRYRSFFERLLAA